MRDPNRIDLFTSALCKLWKENFPDWRFGQLCSNFFGWLMQDKGIDLFYPEEGKMMEYFMEYCEKFGVKNKNDEN